ncbi:MAG: hypothetical protein GY710_07720 [Desulfobacteraceae bacterium]|nr:hypothetical protein [Desulfobacteraceae bacterium]
MAIKKIIALVIDNKPGYDILNYIQVVERKNKVRGQLSWPHDKFMKALGKRNHS